MTFDDPRDSGRRLRDDDIRVTSGKTTLTGHLTIPERPMGLVVFAHGSGSGRYSPRNRHVAAVLDRAGIGTLLVDLLTPSEEAARANVFDIELLARRLADVTRALAGESRADGLALGYFGASTGAAAALYAAADTELGIRTVVSRGGRPDLAGAALSRVQASTLLIVGGDDPLVLELNRGAQAAMTCETEMRVIPGASHLFVEEGTLDQVAVLARDWFTTRLAPATAAS